MVEPKVRFKYDDGSNYPCWYEKKLGELATFFKGQGYSKLDLKEFGNPIILYGRLYTKYQTVINSVDTFAEMKPNSVLSEKGDVIVPASGETPEDISVASVVNTSGVILGGDLNIIRVCEDVKPNYLAYLLTFGTPHYEMARFAQGKSIVHLHNDDLKKASIVYPCLEEQQKIADFLSSIDEVIATSEQEIVNLELQKKAVMKKIFSQEVRFKKDNGSDFPDWKEICIADMGDIHGGLSGKTKNDFGHGEAEFITYMNVYKNTFADENMVEKIEVSKDEQQYSIHYGDILFTQSSETFEEVGLSSVWLHCKEPYLNSFCMVLRPTNLLKIMPRFIGYLFRSISVRKQIMFQGQGVTRINLSPSRLKKVCFYYPVSLEEQQLIADFFSNFDEAISSAKKELELWKELKKGLLQQMFV